MRLASLVVSFLVVVALAARAAAGTLTVTATTTPAGGNYAPRHVVAMWVEDAAGAFVKTVGRWSAARTQYLLAWRAAAGAADTDAVSGATLQNHTAPLTATWNATNRAGVEVPDGTYQLRMELADRNSTSAAQNNQGTFTFTKSAAGFTQTSSNGGFNGVTVTYAAAPAASCDNGVVELGETCDPPGSCPSSCAASADACLPAVLVGSAATCSAVCEVQAITDCGAVDGCCPAGCSATSDGDCASDDSSLSGGCATGSGRAGALALLLGVALLLGKPRRRAA